ncbi:MAG: CDP-alcohol phosphatidyltransferase family protein [Bacteroidales bacterium]|nr:CDP-alcohol phosphatidyltransferase family protein [Bacteroidales bacterium]
MVNWYKEYLASLKTLETEELIDLVVFRPLGFLVVKGVKKTTITPNQLTIAALIAGIAAGFAFAQGGREAFITGSLLYFLFNVLDCSDGQLARLKHNGTPAGRIIDGAADYIAGIAVFLGIGFGYMEHFENPMIWWVILIGATISNILHSMVTDNERLRYMKHAYSRKDAFAEELKEFRRELTRLNQTPGSSWFERTIILIYLKYMQLARKIEKPAQALPELLDKETYRQTFRKLIKAWTFLGPTTHITIVVIASWFMRPDIAAWIILLPMNLYWLIIFLFQQNKLKRFSQTTISTY